MSRSEQRDTDNASELERDHAESIRCLCVAAADERLEPEQAHGADGILRGREVAVAKRVALGRVDDGDVLVAAHAGRLVHRCEREVECDSQDEHRDEPEPLVAPRDGEGAGRDEGLEEEPPPLRGRDRL